MPNGRNGPVVRHRRIFSSGGPTPNKPLAPYPSIRHAVAGSRHFGSLGGFSFRQTNATAAKINAPYTKTVIAEIGDSTN